VEYYNYHEAFPGRGHAAWRSVCFPWSLARWLARESGRFDVPDITTGQAGP